MAPRLLEGEQPDVTYYGVVRSTLEYVDGQRLTSSIYGITIPLTIVVGALTVSHYLFEPIKLKFILGVPVKLQIGQKNILELNCDIRLYRTVRRAQIRGRTRN